MTAIIILNWNGADDTIACLESLSVADGEFVVYVVDNGSTDDSLYRLSAWAAACNSLNVHIVPLERNYGFAVGNNKGLAVARKARYDAYMLLNNDTEVTKDFLVRIEEFAAAHPRYKALTPKINFFYDKNRIWNCGGRLSCGFRKYYYAGSCDTEVKETGYLPITFVTGCALYFKPELMDSEGRLLTERFFFGEEDFEFSLRMKAADVPMACVLGSLIYHKVSASGGNMVVRGKLFLHYLNRFIDIRLNKGALFYFLWALVNVPVCLLRFYRNSRSIGRSFGLVRRLLRDARKKDGVTYEDFESLVILDNYFKAE